MGDQRELSGRASRRWAGLAGAAFGGMLDGIVLHQILHWHQMLSARVPPVSVEAMRLNMAADGWFHLATWGAAVLAVTGLLAQARRAPARALWGAALVGWGLFNLVEGLVDHALLGLHHVVEAAPSHAPADLAFLASGVLLVLVGWALGRGAGQRVVPRTDEGGAGA